MGLAPGIGDLADSHNNFLEQMFKHGMISKKQFGVHTHMWNSTDDPSMIRFGGYDETSFKKGHRQVWLNTLNSTTWEIQFEKVGFKSDTLVNRTRALINPGFPFIGMPEDAFLAFKDDLSTAYPDEKLTCTDKDWCYFFTPCSTIGERMPDLKFFFPMDDGTSKKFSVPAKSFLYSDVDKKTNQTICHLGVIGQTQTGVWNLGQSFMENFYVTFDASGDKLRIGVSSEEEDSLLEKTGFIVALIVVAIFIAIFLVLSIFCCIRKFKENKLKKAKTYFDSLQQQSHDDEDGQVGKNTRKSKKPLHKSAADEELERTNPNSFIGVNSDDDDDEVSSAEARDKVPEAYSLSLTSNERILENLM